MGGCMVSVGMGLLGVATVTAPVVPLVIAVGGWVFAAGSAVTATALESGGRERQGHRSQAAAALQKSFPRLYGLFTEPS